MTIPSYAEIRSKARSLRRVASAVTTFESQLGWIAFSWSEECLSRLTFGHGSPQSAIADLALDELPGKPTRAMNTLAKRLQAFAAGVRIDDFLDIPLVTIRMTPFQQAVVERCRRIPLGETLSYGELASAVGHPGAARAVGRVMATNRFPLIVPCHRVIGSDGALRGFSAPEGITMKRRLLALERLGRDA